MPLVQMWALYVQSRGAESWRELREFPALPLPHPHLAAVQGPPKGTSIVRKQPGAQDQACSWHLLVPSRDPHPISGYQAQHCAFFSST